RRKAVDAPLWPDGWHCSRDGAALGPYTWEELRQRVAAGKLQRSDHLWHDGMDKWAAAETFNGLFPEEEDEDWPDLDLDEVQQLLGNDSPSSRAAQQAEMGSPQRQPSSFENLDGPSRSLAEAPGQGSPFGSMTGGSVVGVGGGAGSSSLMTVVL